MHTESPMTDKEWTRLLADAALYFDDLTLKRGFQYFKQGRVISLKMYAARKMVALVEGRQNYVLDVNLDSLSASQCDCPEDKPCKHMAAVLMQFAQQEERPVAMLANSKALSAMPKPAAEAPSPRGVPVPGRRDLLRQLADSLGEGSVEQWREYMRTATEPYRQTMWNLQQAGQILEQLLLSMPRLTKTGERLFQFHARFYMLEQIIRPGNRPGSNGFVSLGFYAAAALTDLLDALKQLMEQPLDLRSDPEERERLEDTVALLRSGMLAEPRDRSRELPCYSICYGLICRNWLAPDAEGQARLIRELEELNQAAQDLSGAAEQALKLAAARIWVLLGNDLEAQKLLGEAAQRPGLFPEELLGLTEPFTAAEEWERLADWLGWIGPLLPGYPKTHLEHFAAAWEDAVRHRPELEAAMWDSLSGLLPQSGDIYERKLAESGKWQEWMDYHLSSGHTPSQFRAKDLQPAEKAAPEVLLPFYHQAVERLVLEKNRHSYKEAVRLLKRLGKIYKKLKREEWWEHYLSGFSAKHSRLRALQEELQKGKLNP
ncbi:SWIM zinc finger domain-containing protein [Paenibacillus sp. NFR01]|uniref:SWIM zinc finger family protein n=1 Tax=Paenibacillus sp. NFR01 TaxID=1566279 RepID=UPI0008B2509C|nr:SWIM zinc finger family protein [Paenibacillus sp. NFR01]SEU23418.1 Uncharacterized conserved protein, contains Zn finger domain [Paenibacillus sp. NFR01]